MSWINSCEFAFLCGNNFGLFSRAPAPTPSTGSAGAAAINDGRIYYYTRMHSSRMRTARFSGHLYRGWWGSASGSRGLPLGPGGVSDSGSRGSAFGSKGGGVGCLPLGPGGGVVDTPFTTPSPFTTPPFHHKARPKTNTCENITLPQTSVNIQTWFSELILYRGSRRVSNVICNVDLVETRLRDSMEIPGCRYRENLHILKAGLV